ncbi:MAG: 23S rRNA (uracil(1939)-C(5))-methyltransferase RlmD, partial [Fusicatenibacter sp.]
DGPLSLGLHKKGSTYDVLTAGDCRIVHPDFTAILRCVLTYFSEKGVRYYHKLNHEGYLRHLLIRRAEKTGEILVNLVTTSQEEHNLMPLVSKVLELPLEGRIVGFLQIVNDSLADVVQSDETRVLFGQDYFYESLLGLNFKITPFSFFQTNSLGAEVLYSTVRDYVGETKDKTIFDLYSGTGTIAQILAPVAREVIGVEIVEEAVEAAKENAAANGLKNCRFLAGDVLKVIDSITKKPDFIVLDPPRDGIHPKALPKIIQYGVDKMVYISCKPTSLARDLEVLIEAGYRVEKVCLVDLFPGTVHVETVVLLVKKR